MDDPYFPRRRSLYATPRKPATTSAQPTARIAGGRSGTTHVAADDAARTMEHAARCPSFGTTKMARPTTEKRSGLSARSLLGFFDRAMVSAAAGGKHRPRPFVHRSRLPARKASIVDVELADVGRSAVGEGINHRRRIVPAPFGRPAFRLTGKVSLRDFGAGRHFARH